MKLSRCALTLLGTTAVLGAALGCGRQASAPAGTETPEVFTLIQDNEALCARIAKAAGAQLKSAEQEQKRARDAAYEARYKYPSERPPAVPEADPHAVLQRYIDETAAADLAAVDRASELIRGLMPKVQEENSQEVAQAFQALVRSQDQVCQRIRTTQYSVSNFDDGVQYNVRNYEDAKAKLAALYTPQDTEIQFARRKYDPLLAAARANAPSHASDASGAIAKMSPEQYARERQEWQATQDFQARQQAEHEAAVNRYREREEGEKAMARQKLASSFNGDPRSSLSPERMQQTMQTWYATYTARIAPVRTALAGYLSVRKGGTNEEIQPACQELLNATSALLADRTALASPDPAAAGALKKAYSSLRDCAQSCSTAQNAEAIYHLADFENGIRAAAAALQPYSIKP
ncbi:MAG TPA: hypothetical protein VGH73_10040 [Thermoanaerobaculia bacterium]|jgi:hypothetical protein